MKRLEMPQEDLSTLVPVTAPGMCLALVSARRPAKGFGGDLDGVQGLSPGVPEDDFEAGG